MKTAKDFARHGDVLLVAIDIDVEGTPLKDKRLALGEVTGHSHKAEGDCVVVDFDSQLHSAIQDEVRERVAQSLSPEAQKHFSPELLEVVKFLKPIKHTRITHEEHKALSIDDARTRAVIIQRDYEPKGYKKVID